MVHLSNIAFWLCLLYSSKNAYAWNDVTPSDVHINHFKAQAFLVRYNKAYCGASIIGDKFALTAAHCVIDENSNDFEDVPIQIVAVVYDRVNWGAEETRIYRYVEEIVVPNRYQQPLYGSDIAVLKLVTGFGADSGIKVLGIPSSIDNVDSQTASIARFGLEGSRLFLGLVHQNTGVTSEVWCRDLLGSTPYPDLKMCSKSVESTGERCQGKGEGSGLVLSGKVIGVLSYDRECDRTDTGRESVYTKVSQFSEWINNAMNRVNVNEMRIRRYQVY